jgi:hypothetical protein
MVMIHMEETYADGHDTEVLERGKNTSNAKSITYTPARTVEEIEREEAEEKMAINAGIIIMEGWPLYAKKDARQRIPEEDIVEQYRLDDIISALKNK